MALTIYRICHVYWIKWGKNLLSRQYFRGTFGGALLTFCGMDVDCGCVEGGVSGWWCGIPSGGAKWCDGPLRRWSKFHGGRNINGGAPGKIPLAAY